jgi:organic radical activating enzyme
LSCAIKGEQWEKPLQKRLALLYLWRALLFAIKWLPAMIWILMLKKVYIPSVGISITTRCTLKCIHCDHYIPAIEEEYHETPDFETFKKYLDNLLANAEKLFVLRLLGGEPLLNKNLAKMLLYSLEHPKIEHTEIVTNGTLAISGEIEAILKRFPEKSSVHVSNYTSNKALRPKLKTDNIVETLIAGGIRVIFDKELWWSKTAPVKRYYRSTEANKRCYMECMKLTHCLHIRGGKLFICPRAGTFSLRDLYRRFFPPTPGLQENKEYIDLSQPVEKRQFLELFGNDFFNACDYCDNVSEAKGERVTPALQLKP